MQPLLCVDLIDIHTTGADSNYERERRWCPSEALGMDSVEPPAGRPHSYQKSVYSASS
jgi:hypothetical protein